MRNEYNLFIRPEEVFQLIAVDFFKRERSRLPANSRTMFIPIAL